MSAQRSAFWRDYPAPASLPAPVIRDPQLPLVTIVTPSNGARSAFLASGVDEDLHAVWGAGGEVWAAGDGGVVLRSHDNGATWQRVLFTNENVGAVDLASLGKAEGEEGSMAIRTRVVGARGRQAERLRPQGGREHRPGSVGRPRRDPRSARPR